VEQLLENYGAVLVAIPVGIFLVLSALLAVQVLAPRRKTVLKSQVYECGMLPIGRNWAQIHVRYYVYAILFLVFDVEIIFLFPWAVSFMGLMEGEAAFDKVILWQMVLFIVTLLFGLAYAWRKGVLEWQRKTEAPSARP
jgi:NADH:ubiquinone oxidoreductase subunit 3 (subunit A)